MKRPKSHVFRAPTLTEAMREATVKLGKDVALIEHREVTIKDENSIIGKIISGKSSSKTMVEIVVAKSLDNNHLTSIPTNANTTVSNKKNKCLEKIYNQPSPLLDTFSLTPKKLNDLGVENNLGSTSKGIAAKFEEFNKKLEEEKLANAKMREDFLNILSLQARGGLPAVRPELLHEYKSMLELDIKDDIAREVIEFINNNSDCMPNHQELKNILCNLIAKRISSAGPVLIKDKTPTLVALIGPTGVGKSTTIAKLALDFILRQKKTVGLINEDKVRPGAEEQLRSFSRLMALRLVTATDPETIKEAVNSMSDLDVILLDTAGRSPKDSSSLKDLSAIIKYINPDETHLVLSAGSSEKTVFQTINKFRKIGFDRLILTKLDETVTHGMLLNIASELSEGLSYVTTGQEYMESLISADSSELAKLVLGISEVGPGGIKSLE